MKHTTVRIEGLDLRYLLYLDNSDSLKGNHWLFHLHVIDNGIGLDLADNFKFECYGMPKSLNWFHQGGCIPGPRRSPWHMFEFWKNDQAAILEAAMEIAETLDLELQIGNISRADLDFIEGK
jgi:hypothetical protein